MTREQSLLTRTLHVGSTGEDVRAVKRTIARYLANGKLKTLNDKPLSVQRMYGPWFAADVVKARRQAGFDLRPIVGPAFFDFLAKKGAPDALAVQMLNNYRDKLPPPKPKLVCPNQGWGSLDRRLWELYSIGRNMGLTDLGTYNPASRLPSGRPSDHAVHPAVAFDLGIDPDNGFLNTTGRKFFQLCTTRPEVEYVILGTKIWSRSKGLHRYTGGSHGNHIHVSGRR